MRQSQHHNPHSAFRIPQSVGVSLVEVMVSCTIFITASLGAFACLAYGTSRLNVENHRRTAVEVAHSRMETLRTAVFANLPSLAETDTAVTIDDTSGTRDTTVTAIDENSDDTIDHYTVTVAVEWPERGATQSVQLATLFSDPTVTSGAEEPETPMNVEICVVAYRGQSNVGYLATMYMESSGQMSDAVLDTLQFDYLDTRDPKVIHVSGSIYAVVYRGLGHDGFVKTVTIGADGQIGNSILDSFTFDSGKGEQPSVCLVSSGILAIAYKASGDDGYVKTVHINSAGQISDSVVDSLLVDSSKCKRPKLLHVGGNVYAIAYEGNQDDGYVKTVTIESDGQIGSVVDSLEFDTNKGREVDICHVTGEIYAIVYKGPQDDGYLVTAGINASGQIQNSTIDSLEFDGSKCVRPKIIQVDENTFAIAYTAPNNRGTIKTVTIAADGQINNSTIDSLIFDSQEGKNISLCHVVGEYYAVAYKAQGNDGYTKTVQIDSSGQIGNVVVDSLFFSGYSKEPHLVAMGSGSVSDKAAHWKLDDDSGVTAVDSAGSNDGTLINGPVWTSDGRLDGALNFDGYNDYVDVGAMDVCGSAMTISAWLWLDSNPGEARVVSKALTLWENGHYWMLSTYNNTRLRFRLKTDSSWNTRTLNSDNVGLPHETWIHAAAVYDGSTMKLYKNGDLVGSRSKSGNITTSSLVPVWIGNNAQFWGSQCWPGKLDDIRIYRRALSQEEIQALAAGTGSSSIQLGAWSEE